MSDPQLVDEVYAELRKIAAIHLSRSVQSPSLQATQLVHEAWLRLSTKGYKSRTHFLALASRSMRMILIDAARARMADRRGGGETPLAIDCQFELGAAAASPVPLEQMIEIDRALDELSTKDSRKAQVVELRFFGGLDLEECAEVLDISLTTVKRDWEFARSWLFARLSSGRP